MELNKANLQDLYPLSPMQQGMLFHAVYQPDSQAYFEQMRYDIEGILDSKHLKQSWQLLHNRHDVLRTVFVYKKSAKLLQMVLKHRDVEFGFSDLSALGAAQQIDQIEQYRQQDRARGFVLTKDRLSRIQLFKIQSDHHVMIWSVHHIILDAWCFGIIYRELMACYRSLLQRQALYLPPAPPYSRYIQWLEAQDNVAARDFWQQYLQDYDEAVSLYGLQQQHSGEYVYAKQTLCLSACDSASLRQAARTAQVTLNTAIQAAWALLLSMHNDSHDIVFGVTVSGRPPALAHVENTVGLFINTVPLRIRIDDQLNLSAYWRQVQQQALITESHQYYSLADIQSLSQLKQNLLNHVLVFENIPQADDSEPELQANGFVIRQTDMFEHPHYPFMLSINPDAAIALTMTYNRAVFSDKQIERVAAHLLFLLQRMAQSATARIIELMVLPDTQQAEILNGFSAITEASGSTLPALFAQQQALSPDITALSDTLQSLSYSQLHKQSNRLAHYLLQHHGLKAEDKVAVLLPRTVDLPLVLLAILKSGAAYVPLDSAYPKARIEYILEHSRAALLITGASDGNWPVPVVTVDHALGERGMDEVPDVKINPEQLAYLIYTSGSTGQPKGVMVEHGNIAAFCNNLRQRFYFNENDRLLALTTVSFDISVLELLCVFTIGMQVVIADDTQVQIPESVIGLIQTQAITVLQATPSRLQWLLNAGGIAGLSGLRIILVGGEALPESLAAELKQLTNTQVINVYGPTEATIWSTCKPLSKGFVTIGTALVGEGVYILSAQRSLQAIGVTGEIVITGAGVSRGYWQDVERTDKVFTSDPFRPGRRMYASGDLGRWLDNGEIECLGRKDDQIKIRGYRIELGEIERQALKYPAVAQVAVVTGGDAEHSVLNAFIVTNSVSDSTDVLTVELRKHLAQWLPEYMIPSRFIIVDELPLNSNGKIDRKALVRTLEELTVPIRPFRAPRTDREQQLVMLWEQVLSYRPIGIDDDFFSLGGNSINAIQLLAQLSKLYGRDILLSDFWAHPSIADFSAAMSADSRPVMKALNSQTRTPGVFCFPPISGFGAVFRGLADYLAYSCYSFDMVVDVDNLAYAIAAIKQVQPQGPYVLLGYSAGGNYAYSVAAALQNQGEQVSALILIDSIRVMAISVLSEREKQQVIEQALQESQLPLALDKESMRTTMSAYLDFILQHPNHSGLTANLFCLSAENQGILALPGNGFSLDWITSTSGTVTNYQGAGNHFQVLTQPQLTHNAKIIQEILDSL